MKNNKKVKFDAEATIAWLRSEEGAKQFRENMKKAEKECELMRKKCQVDPKELLKPMTI